jgi:hypothetical protein
MKEMLTNLADGQIELYKTVRLTITLFLIRADFIARLWTSGRGSSLSFNVFAWTFSIMLPGF